MRAKIFFTFTAMSKTPEKVNVLCLKWGTRYGADYVNKLYAGTQKHLHRAHDFYCCTDDSSGLNEGIKVIPFPENPGVQRPWPDILVKLVLCRDGFGDLHGPTLFLDLDVVILDRIDDLFDYKQGEFCIIHNWVNWRKKLMGKRPHVGNSSVFRFEAGSSQYIYDTFLKEIDRAQDKSQFTTEQAFLTYAAKDVNWWPEEWVQSYKWNCRPAFPANLWLVPKTKKGCKILVFHGRPDPDEAIRGYRGKKPHHHTKPAAWIADHWRESL